MTRGAVWAGLWASAGARAGAGADADDDDGGRRASNRVRRRPARVLITAALVAAFAAGCTSPAPEPSPTPAPSTAAPAPSPEPTPETLSAPVRPAEMSQVDEAGAMAAARYFLELYAYVMATGDLTDWKRFTAQSCGFCANVIDEVEAAYGTGGYFTGGEFTFGDPVHVAFDPTLYMHAIEAAYSTTPSAEYDAAGNLVRDFAADGGYIVLEVVFTEGGWLLQTGSARDEPVQP